MAELIRATNHSDFFYKAIELILTKGKLYNPRGMEVLEVEDVLYHIEKPYQKQLFVWLRGNNPIATMAEVLWVLAGRDDMEYLTYYLPRAIDFSDDGKVWRGAYGPRLRNWNGTDQLREVIKILENDRDSRRAVMMIYDPDRDFVESKDIPCNNQLAFTIRDDKLNVKICSRSMDIIWGSTVDTITWAVLQEVLAGIMKAGIGTMSYFVSSMHLYTKFKEKVQSIVPAQGSTNPYTDPHIPILMFNVFDSIDEFDKWLKQIMQIEEEIRTGERHKLPPVDELLTHQILTMLLVYRYLWEGDREKARKLALDMEDTDFSRALLYYVEQDRL